MAGKTIRLFLVDGRSAGILMAEIGNWTGRITVTPRTKLSEFVGRPDAKRTGVYILVGDDPSEKFDDAVYIGEGDNVYARLYAHSTDSSKEFWTTAVVVTSKDENLTKAHVRYLESRLIDIANGAQRSQVTNSTAPTPPRIPEPDVADMEFFLDQTLQTLPVLGFNFLVPRRVVDRGGTRDRDEDGNSRVQFILRGNGAEAHAVEIGGEFVVLKGSTARRERTPGMKSYRTLHQRLTDSDLFAKSDNDELYELTDDTPFRSASAAAAVMLGRNANGRTEWKVEGTGKTYADWQAANPPPDDEPEV